MAIHVEHVGVLERAREVSRLEDIITEDNEDIEAEMPKMRDDPAGKEARFLQATDEMSAALTQFMKKKIYEEQLANFLDGEEYVLEDQPIEKTDKVMEALKAATTHDYEVYSFAKKLFPDESDLVVVLRAVFLCLAVILGIYFYFKFKKKGTEETVVEGDITVGLEPYNQDDDISLGIINKLDQVITETVPLVLIMNSVQAKKYTEINLADRIRSQFFIEYGIRIPGIVIREGEGLNDEDVILMLNEVRASQFKIYHDLVLLVEYSDEVVSTLIKKPVIVNSNGEQYYWVTKSDAQKLTKIGCYTRTAMDEMYNHLSVCLAHNINEYFGIQETKYILDQLEMKYSDLLKEILRYITVQRISEVIQRLIQERISVRNMRLVMEALALWSPREKDIITLVEHVRGALGRYICHKFSYSGEIKAIVISPEIEDRIRDGVRPTAGGTFLNLDASEAEMILDNFKLALSGINIPIKDIILLGSVDIRRFIKKLIESSYRDLEVLSYGELTENVPVNILKTI